MLSGTGSEALRGALLPDAPRVGLVGLRHLTSVGALLVLVLPLLLLPVEESRAALTAGPRGLMTVVLEAESRAAPTARLRGLITEALLLAPDDRCSEETVAAAAPDDDAKADDGLL